MIKEPTEEELQKLCDLGDSLAEKFIKNAIDDSKDAMSLSNRIYTLRVMASHLLGSMAFNIEQSSGSDAIPPMMEHIVKYRDAYKALDEAKELVKAEK